MIKVEQDTAEIAKSYYAIEGRLSNSTFKYYKECSARAYAAQTGDFVRPFSTALIEGSYVDEMLFEEQVMVDTSSLYKKDGDLKKANEYLRTIVQDVKNDPVFWDYLIGNYQMQKNFEINGLPWKGKLDVMPDNYPDTIVDFKTAANISEWLQSKRFEARVPFIYARGYDVQGAIYCEAWKKKRFILAIATKQSPSGRHIVEIPKEMLDNALEYVKANQELVFQQMQGNKLEYCKSPDCTYCRGKRPTVPVMAGIFLPREETPF